MILVKDAEINHETHEAELQTTARLFADVKTTNRETLELIPDILKNGGHAGCDKLFRESDSSPRQDGCPETSQRRFRYRRSHIQ